MPADGDARYYLGLKSISLKLKRSGETSGGGGTLGFFGLGSLTRQILTSLSVCCIRFANAG
ncbi:hypothetical protein [uncultured Nostoc sp.]|uniref:hypothetical protein n=1 Tax=uncultured Nostoc sp. TaxID=340711 RepID=UPI0035CB95C6